MDVGLGEKTAVGVLTAAIIAIGVALRHFVLWLFGLNGRIVAVEKGLSDFDKKIIDHIEMEEERAELSVEMNERMARVETKLDLLIDNKITR
jgi:hypothetical protein